MSASATQGSHNNLTYNEHSFKELSDQAWAAATWTWIALVSGQLRMRNLSQTLKVANVVKALIVAEISFYILNKQ